MLAAEMIYRSTDAVWLRVGSNIQALVGRWHTAGKVDRAVRFMIASGRHEFFDRVWPLITDESEQVSLSAYCARPDTSVSFASRRRRGWSDTPTLPLRRRKIVLHEIVLYGGADGLELSAAIGKDDPDPEVKAMVVDVLAFRRADRHITDVFSDADDSTFDLVAQSRLVEQVAMELSEPLAVVSLGRDGLPIEPGRRGLSPNPGKPAFAVKMQDLHNASHGWGMHLRVFSKCRSN